MAFRTQIKAQSGQRFSQHMASVVRNLSEKHLSAISEESARTMREKISNSITRADSSGKLEGSIRAERIASGHYGVGNIENVEREAPYWAAVNFGSSHMVNKRVPTGGFNPGFQPPIQGGSGQRWFVAQGGYSFVPKNPIRPMNYIAQTVFEQNRIISGILRTVR